MSDTQRLSTKLTARAKKRKERHVEFETLRQQGWVDVDKQKMCFNLTEYDKLTTSFASTTKRYSLTTLCRLDIFLEFISPSFIRTILEGYSAETWRHCTGRHVPVGLKQIYYYIALYVRIQGLQVRSTRTHPGRRSLRESIGEAINHFEKLEVSGVEMTSNSAYVEHFFANFHIKCAQYNLLSENFQGIFNSIGQFVACDEKVFEFTGWHCFVLKVPSKGATGEMGLWVYQMCCQLANGMPFMLHCKLKSAEKGRGEGNPVVDAVASWVEVIENFEPQLPNPDCPTVMCIDSYYFSKDVISLLESKPSIKFLLAATEDKCYDLCSYLKDKVTVAGHWEAIYNTNTKFLLTHYFHPHKKLGRKYVLTNALSKYNRKQTKGMVPGCDEYSYLYSICDKFNEFHGYSFPHKHGGKHHPGVFAAQHDFALTSALKNTFNLYEDAYISALKSSKASKVCDSWTFREHCLLLSNELYSYACSME